MKKKLTLLIDGQGLLKQSYHGNKNTYGGANGNHIGALYTSLTIIRKLIVEQKPDRVVMMWDGGSSGKLRYEQYPLYKANRGKNYAGSEFQEYTMTEAQERESISRQRERIMEYCEELYIRQVVDEYTEADDLIAHYCLTKPDNEEIIIYSNDRDMAQLVSDDISFYIANERMLINANTFFLKFKYHLSNSALVKALEGCSSDNIIGFSSVGEKTILDHFPEISKQTLTFEYILTKCKKINEDRKLNKLKPLKVLENICNGVMKRNIMLDITDPTELYNLNFKLVNLKEPFITDEAVEAIDDIRNIPLDDTDRGAKPLLRMMTQDGFIDAIPGKKDGYVDYILPFNTIVKQEKLLLEIYKRNNS